MKCGLDFCGGFTDYIINSEELDDGLKAPLIHLRVYTFEGRCAKHGKTPNGPTL